MTNKALSQSTIQCSIIMAVFNAEQYLEQAIRSVCNQSEVNFELLIVDDASTDRTPDIIRSLMQADIRIRLIENPRNIGQSASLNIGISESTGEFVCFFDGDDICYPERVKSQILFLIQNPLHVMVGCSVRTLCSLNNTPGVIWNYETDEDLIQIKSLFKSEFISSSMMMRKQTLIKNQVDLNVELKVGADWALSLQLMKIGKVANLSTILFDYRIHAEQMTNSLIDSIYSDSAKIRLGQLRELGIEPSELELKIHLAVSPCNYWPMGQHPYFQTLKPDLENLSRLWFDKLLEHNQKTRRYHPQKFAMYLNSLSVWIKRALLNNMDYKTCPALGEVKCNTLMPCKKLA